MVYILNDLKWKTLNNFKNIKSNVYQVSNYGDVRLKKSKLILHKKIANKKFHPYHAVYLKNNNNKGEWVLVHQLVAYLYCKVNKKYKNKKIELVPDHLDNNGLNNYYQNLEWKSRSENVKAAFEKGYTDFSCENHKDSFITNNEAHNICILLEKMNCIDDILIKLGYPINKKYRTLITRIHRKSSFYNISSKYNFVDKLYTKNQSNNIKHLKNIIEYIDNGYDDKCIYDKIWGKPKYKEKRKGSKMLFIKGIRERSIYTDEINKIISSTTRES